jgi:hypothetical protein
MVDTSRTTSATSEGASKHRDCEELKDVYDKCFRSWYRYSFLRGDFEDPCLSFFEEYNSCLIKSLETKGLGSLMETDNSMWRYDPK